MRPRCRLSPLAFAVWGIVALTACRVEAPPLECVRDGQCRVGQVCEGNRCVVAPRTDLGQDPAEEAPPDDAPDDPAQDILDEATDAPLDPDGAGDTPEDSPSDLVDAPEEPSDDALDVRPDLPSLDPAPELTEPGKHRCEGGPDADLAGDDTYQHLLGADPTNAFVVSGTVTGTSDNGAWYVRMPTGRQSAGTLATNANGTFRAVVPITCSLESNVVKLVWDADPCDLVLVFDVQNTLCWNEDVHVGLWWNEQGDAQDLHLIREAGRINTGDDDCNSDNCIGASPDWGAPGLPGNPRKSFDGGAGGGPEEIVVDVGASGTYTIAVERWGTSETPSDAVIIAAIEGQPFVTIQSEIPARHVWLAAEIDFEAARWRPIVEVIDCSDDWHETLGCMLDIP